MNAKKHKGTEKERRDSGVVLFAVLATLAGLALLSATIFMIVATDLKIAGNLKYGQQAFYNADGAISYIRGKIEADLVSDTLTLTNARETVSYSAPSGFTFDTITKLTRLSSTSMDAYTFKTTGHDQSSAVAVEATFKRKSAMPYGVFGGTVVDAKAYGRVYSYNSSVTPNPTPADSTGEADTASNEDYVTHVGTYIDGDLALGADDYGTMAYWADPGSGSTVTGNEGVSAGHIEPDPLGAIGGSLADEFTAASVTNNNASASPAISGNTIALGSGQSMTLSAGTYYVSSITLNNSATLNINATSGPVKIYLTGAVDAKNGSAINLTGLPPNFAIYSNSSQPISLYNSSTYKGTIYAPYASVEVKNSADFYGLVWADSVDIKNSGNLYVDVSIEKAYALDKIAMLSWKEIRK